MISKENAAFIASLVPGAQAAHKAHQVPASVTLAQAILESAWGKSRLTKDAFNLFGVKADKSWHGNIIIKSTAEYVDGKKIMIQAPFRRYDSLAESIEDHAVFLVKNKRYAKAFKCKDGCKFAEEVARSGYATDMKYAELLVSIIKQHHLMQYDLS